MLVATVFWGIIKGALQGLGFGMAFWMILHGSALASFIGTVHNVIATVIYGFAAVESFSRGNNAQGIIRGIIASITGLASAIGILRGCGLLELSNCTSAENIYSLAQSGLDALNDNQGCVGSETEPVNLAQLGDNFGRMGTYVNSPNITVDWNQYAGPAMERMEQRGMTVNMVNDIVENGRVLMQNNGDRFAFITREGVVILSREGRLITMWSSADYDSNMVEIVGRLFGE